MTYTYFKKGADLELIHSERGRILTIGADESVAFIWDEDSLFIHGSAQQIRHLADRYRGKIAGDGFSRSRIAIEVIEVPVWAISLAVLEEINACLSIKGHVGRLPERLQAIAEAENCSDLRLAMMVSPSSATH
jgi:hypothetical protein